MGKLAERLKLLRSEAQLSQAELAKQLKISKSSINMYERGEREPSIETLENIADYFNVDMDYLLGHSNHRNKYQWLQAQTATPMQVDLPNPLSILDLIQEQCGETAKEAFAMYLALDNDDRGEIRGEMKHMLKAEKYSAEERLRNA